jgi:hypothetical protein
MKKSSRTIGEGEDMHKIAWIQMKIEQISGAAVRPSGTGGETAGEEEKEEKQVRFQGVRLAKTGQARLQTTSLQNSVRI